MINFEAFDKKSIGHQMLVTGIDICQPRNLLASGSDDKTVKLWSLENNKLLKTYQNSGPVYDVVFSNQGNLLTFSGGGDYSVKLIDITKINQKAIIFEFKGHNNWIYRLTFSNDSKYLISGSADNTMRIWDIQQQKESFKLNSGNSVCGVTISGDDNLIASSSFKDGILRIWNFQNQKLLCTQKAHTQGAGIEFSNDQKMLVSSGYDIGTIKLWSLEQLNQRKLLLIRRFKAATKCIWAVLFSPCSGFIISMSNLDRQIKVTDLQTGKVVKIYKSKATNGQYIQFIISFIYLSSNVQRQGYYSLWRR